MFHTLVPLVLWLALAPSADMQVGTGPQPSATPVSWELDIKFLDPARIEVQLPGNDRPTVYWYMVYTVINNTGRSQRFAPIFQIVTADLRLCGRCGGYFVIGRGVHQDEAGQHNHSAMSDSGPQKCVGIANGANQVIK